MKGPAERFLEDVKRQRSLVAALERDLERIRAEVTGLRSQNMEERVQSGRQKDLSDAVIWLEESEKKVERELERLIRMREEARRLIDREENPKLRAILYCWYILDEGIHDMAAAMEISERHIWRMKKEAVYNLEKAVAEQGIFRIF